ncbi:STAS domain-containing protein [Geodermatophilus sp. SYSU D00708]
MTAESACAAGAADGRDPSFTVDLDLIGGRLKLTGPLERDTTHLFHDAVVTLLVCDRPRWTVDLSELTACGRTGAHVIAGARRWAQRQNRRMMLVGTPLWLQRELTRLQLHHRPVPDVPGVVTAAGGATADAAPTAAERARPLERP